MIRNMRPRTYRRRLGQSDSSSDFGQTCQPACSSGGTLCPDPTGFLASINPCCSSIYTATPNDGYCGGGATPAVAAVTGATVGAEDCSAGGTLCPDPSGSFALLNPCCSVQSGAAGAPAPLATSPLIWVALGIGGALVLGEVLR